MEMTSLAEPEDLNGDEALTFDPGNFFLPTLLYFFAISNAYFCLVLKH